jgi:hypothetical protein
LHPEDDGTALVRYGSIAAPREAVIARDAAYRFFERLRIVTAYVVF